MNNNIPLTSSMLINLPVTGQDNKIGAQEVLTGKKVKAVITRVGTTGLKTSNGKDISSNLDNAHLVLVNSQNTKVHEGIPLYLLDPTKNGGTGIIPLAANVDWTKSTISFADGSQVAANVGKEIPLLVIFE